MESCRSSAVDVPLRIHPNMMEIGEVERIMEDIKLRVSKVAPVVLVLCRAQTASGAAQNPSTQTRAACFSCSRRRLAGTR